ncbi:MAG: polysulfide reductase NrfD [Proteobacteria bacterium]|nr:polysulfide reductase NrfD [Pseudomonadota bacterium]
MIGIRKGIADIKSHLLEVYKATGKGFCLFIIILLFPIAWGMIVWYHTIVEGHLGSGMSDVVPWGVFISALAYFVGASAGATIVGLLIYAFGRTDYKPIGAMAILFGLICIFGATQFVMMDVGVPWRALKVPWILHNPTSMFFISSTSYFGFMIILTAELYFSIKVIGTKPTGFDKKMAKWLGILAVPYALFVVHTFTGTIFGVIKAREMWNTPLIPVHFVLSALACGFAGVALVTVITAKLEKREILTAATYSHMGLVLAGFITATLFLDFTDYIVLLYSQTAEGVETWHIISERYTGLFILNILGLVVADVILMTKRGRTENGLLIATTLTMLAIGAYRITLVSIGQIIPLYPQLGEVHYVPSREEVIMGVGMLALMVLLYSVLAKALPIRKSV